MLNLNSPNKNQLLAVFITTETMGRVMNKYIAICTAILFCLTSQVANATGINFCYSGTVTDPGDTTLSVGETINGSFQADDLSSGNNGNATFYPLITANVSNVTFGLLEWNGVSGSASVSNDLQGLDQFNFNAGLGSPDAGSVLIQTQDNEATVFNSEVLPTTSLPLTELEVRMLQVVFSSDGAWGNCDSSNALNCSVTANLTRLDVGPSCVDDTAVVSIDVKPGSDPNCFNINGHGVIPVAILGSQDLDVSNIDVTSLLFGGLEVRVRGNKGPLCSVELANGDSYLDLVCHFADDPSNWTVGETDEASLKGTLLDGTDIEGTDSICVVP